jgi:hypothetical protein
MQFIYPSFLWAMALVLIPIAIHLFNFQRAKKVYFTNVSFLREIKSVSSAQNKLRHLLVLLMRCLFIIALVLAFAQAYIPANQALNSAGGSRFVSMYLDNSFSMQAEQNNKKLLDTEMQLGEKIIGLFPKNTQFQILANGNEGNMNYFTESKKAIENISHTHYSSTGRNLQSIYSKQKVAFRNYANSTNNFVFWLSDFQKSMFNPLKIAEMDSSNTFYLVPMQSDAVSNIYVDSIWLENPFIKLQENNTLYVKIHHFGKQGVSERTAKLFIDGKQVSNGTISIEANGNTTLKMSFAVQESGAKNCRISLEDSPILFDNDYYFTLQAAPTIKIVHLTADKDNFINNVYQQETFFQLQSFSTNAIDYNALQTADLVVLQGIETIDQALLTVLQKFAQRGGTLAIFPHENSNIESYSNLIGFPIQIVKGEKIELLPPDTKNPFYTGIFERITATMNMPICQQSIEIGNIGQNLLKFKNEKPFLKYVNNSRNKLFICTSPLKEGFSDLGKHAIFVPLMYKIALHATRQSNKLAYNFEEEIAEVQLVDSLVSKNDIFKLLNIENQTEIIPAQRIADGKLLLEIPKMNLSAGNYQIIRKSDKKIVNALALNYNKTESIVDCYSVEELQRLFANHKNVQIFQETETANFTTQFQEKNIAKPLWRYFIFIALFFLLTETLLLRRK